MSMTKRMKKVMACILLSLSLMGMMGNTACATSSYDKKITKKNEKFSVETAYGMGGLVYYDMPAMVSIAVTCTENFSGTIQLIPGTGDYGSVVAAYAEDVSLSAGETKTIHFIPTSIGNNGKVVIRILNEKGKVVYQESNQLTLESGGSKVSIGILSEDYSGLSYFDGIGMMMDGTQALTTIFELDQDNFPEDALGLSMLQYMVIDNFDTASLSEKQYQALKSWVQDGGVLILGLGSNYQNVLHCFDDTFVSGTLGTLKQKVVTWDGIIDDMGMETTEQEETAEQNQEQATESAASLKMDCVEFQLEGGEPFPENTSDESAYMKEIGLGRVVVLGYSMGMEPMTSFKDKQSVVKFIIENAAGTSTHSRFYGNDEDRDALYSGVEIAKLADSSRRPSVVLYGLLLFLYVILVGPILYVVLKALNKREKIWLAIPVVALVFTGIIYLTGFLYRINKPLISTFTVIQLQEQEKLEKVYTNIVCPKPKEYQIQFSDAYTGFKRNNSDYYYNVFGNSTDEINYAYLLKKNSKGTEMILDNTEPFQQVSFSLNRNSENNIGTIDSDLTCYTTGFEGTVTNHTCYDLEDLVVSFENYICLVGDVKKGETVTIDSNAIVTSRAYGTFENLYPSRQVYSDQDMYLRYQINNMAEANLIDKNQYHTGYIWASFPSYQPDIVEDSNVKQSGCGVLLTTFEAGYADVKGAFYPTIDGLAVASQGDFDSNDRSIYSNEVVITYLFAECNGMVTLENIEDGNSYNNYGTPADVYAYNMEIGDYEQIFTNGNVMTSQEMKKYMFDDAIVLKYVQSSNGYGAYIPRISAKGE